MLALPPPPTASGRMLIGSTSLFIGLMSRVILPSSSMKGITPRTSPSKTLDTSTSVDSSVRESRSTSVVVTFFLYVNDVPTLMIAGWLCLHRMLGLETILVSPKVFKASSVALTVI